MWILPLYLHVNQKSEDADDNDDDEIRKYSVWGIGKHCMSRSASEAAKSDKCLFFYMNTGL